MRPLIKLWRGKGVRCVVYLDDGIIIATGIDRARSDSCLVKESLESAGFVVNTAKSHWEPKHEGQWLGFNIDLESGYVYVSVPPQKIISLQNLILQVCHAQTLPAKVLASIIGRLISMGLGLGSVVRLRTRCMYALLNRRSSWYEDLRITEDVRRFGKIAWIFSMAEVGLCT